MGKRVNILDTTLRDGSYAADFSFSPADTASVCRKLEEAGVEYIEVGHGFGLNAGSIGLPAAATDKEYAEAARAALTRAKVGVFCATKVARIKDVELARASGADFLRIGINTGDTADAQKFIERAKARGMLVSANFMRSSLVAPEELARQAKLCEDWGADIVYIVDSAGGLFPEDVRKYYQAIRTFSDITVGFHGHDNLGLAVANSIAAAEAGINFIDSSLQGLGRGAGNTQTEVLVAALAKRGYETGIDFIKILEAGENSVKILNDKQKRAPLDIAGGYADFVSFNRTYSAAIKKYAEKYGINHVRLIVELSKIDNINALDERQLEELAERIKDGS